MRIAVVQTELTWFGGIERFLFSVLPRLAKKDEVAVFTTNFLPDALSSPVGFRVFETGGRTSFGGHFEAFFRARTLRRLLRMLKDWNPDVVLIQKDIRFTRWLSAELGRTPVIVYMHDIIGLRYLLRRMEKRSKRKIGRLSELYLRLFSSEKYESAEPGNARLVACVSRFVQGQVSQLWKGVETRLILNGVDHEFFSPTWEDDGFVLCISRIDKSKNLELVLDNFQGAKYPVIVCGNTHAGDHERDAYARGLFSNVQPPIHVRLNQDPATLKRLLQTSSLLLHPGKEEGFSLLPIEGMACGKPVIAHNSGGTPESVGEGGFLLGDDGRKWRHLADELMDSRQRRREIRGEALEYSLRFDWGKTAEEVRQMCFDVLTNTIARYQVDTAEVKASVVVPPLTTVDRTRVPRLESSESEPDPFA